MKQRGMTHQRKQALAVHAIAGIFRVLPHTCVTTRPESEKSQVDGSVDTFLERLERGEGLNEMGRED